MALRDHELHEAHERERTIARRESRELTRHRQEILDERALSARRASVLVQPGVEDDTGFSPGSLV